MEETLDNNYTVKLREKGEFVKHDVEIDKQLERLKSRNESIYSATDRYPQLKTQQQTQRPENHKILNKARMCRMDRNRLENDHSDDGSVRSISPGVANRNLRQRSLQPPPNTNQNMIDMFVDDNLSMPQSYLMKMNSNKNQQKPKALMPVMLMEGQRAQINQGQNNIQDKRLK